DKGVEVLIEAARLLKGLGRKFRVQFVGEFSSDEYRETVRSYVSEMELEHCVEFCGRKLGDEKWAHYRGADIFCFPTHYSSESFGNVLVEAMMFELPVVSTKWRGIPGIVEEGITGFLTDIRDPQATAERIIRLLDNEALRTSMGREGRERYLEQFTVETYLERTREVVLEVAKKKPAQPILESTERRSVAAGAR
ncbi:MAG TPA: glycosyltransferase, partial [Pyrinomonadaceae bacterium]|nr:glycosyltransferase [Pyrinomonadaceae bacterium]